jgi:hypothetical protein
MKEASGATEGATAILEKPAKPTSKVIEIYDKISQH